MFNPNARWDRHLPNESYDHESPIEVAVIFKEGKMFPRWFVWNARKYPIKEVTYQWQDKRGEETLVCFSVSDGVNVFQIHLNLQHLCWRLQKVLSAE